MENNMISLTLEEYKDLIDLKVRREILEDYVNGERYSLDKDRVRRIMKLSAPVEEDV